MRSFIRIGVLCCAMLLASYVAMAQRPLQSGLIVSRGRCVDALRALQRENTDSMAVVQLYKYYVFSRDSLPQLQPHQWRRTFDAIMADSTRRCVLKSVHYQQHPL
ncbi:MAG: hypothetical protein IJU72_01390 [Bacteroidales bacterium]|nr:hypothetical protein [Bacteroidales bacterium]